MQRCIGDTFKRIVPGQEPARSVKHPRNFVEQCTNISAPAEAVESEHILLSQALPAECPAFNAVRLEFLEALHLSVLPRRSGRYLNFHR